MPRLRILLSLALCLLASRAAVAGIGYRSFAVSNPSPKGSKTLKAKLWYPAQGSGSNRPLSKISGGRPVIVFLAGYTFVGSDYQALGQAFAQHGYVAVMNESHPTNGALQGEDGIAWFGALTKENANKSSVLYKALDMMRVGVVGHSMGGANAQRAATLVPGYRVVLAFSPLILPPNYLPGIKVPLGIIVGSGDQTTAWKAHAYPSFQKSSAFRGIKFLYLFNSSGTHANVARRVYPGATSVDAAIFDRSARVALGFLDHYLKDNPYSLNEAVGPKARSESRLQQLFLDVQDPAIFQSGSRKLGKVHESHLVSGKGFAVHMLALGKASIPTALGTLLLDPGSAMFPLMTSASTATVRRLRLPLPKNGHLDKLRIYFQGLAATSRSGLRFSNSYSIQLKD